MDPAAAQSLHELRARLRPACLAQVGGFRPPDDPRASWFGRAVGLPGELRPTDSHGDLFPLLQINVGELPFVPPEFANVALLVVFFTRGDLPFEQPHGDGWLIREYTSIDGLVLLPPSGVADPVKHFPLRWRLISDDSPSWEDADSVIDTSAINADRDAIAAFHDSFNQYSDTKVGGFPCAIQHEVGLDGYVFQIGSEDKAQWQWVDNGIAYFFRSGCTWRWDCQFY